MEMPEEHRMEAEWEMPGELTSPVAPVVMEEALYEMGYVFGSPFGGVF